MSSDEVQGVDKQQLAIDTANSGENLFLSGPAGVGKSWTLERMNQDNTLTVAPTAVAALNVGGDTASSVFSLPNGVVIDSDLKKCSYRTASLITNPALKAIRIDEVGMLRSDKFDLIDKKCKLLRDSKEPFGGLQVILSGDLFQLPPILQGDEKAAFRKAGYHNEWFFSTKAFRKANFKVIELDKVHRQNNLEQILALNSIRSKSPGWENAVENINRWSRDEPNPDQDIVLCSLNRVADKINREEYSKLSTPEFTFIGRKVGEYKIKKNVLPEILTLRVGTRVVITANADKSRGGDPYTNGMTGTVVDYVDDVGVYVETDKFGTMFVEKAIDENYGYSDKDGKLKRSVIGSFQQIPLRLGYAISVHKSQGMTLDGLSLHLAGGFSPPGLTYVGLSRAKDLTNIYIPKKLTLEDIQISGTVKNFMQRQTI